MIRKFKGSKYQFIAQACIWLVAIIVALTMMPNTAQLLHDKAKTQLPKTATSQVANTLQNKWGKKQANTRQVVVVFNNGTAQITAKQQRIINQKIKQLKEHQVKYGIKEIITAKDSKLAKQQLISKDQTTELVQVAISKNMNVNQTEKQLGKAIATNNIKTYVTGGDILDNDFSNQTAQGLKKTESIALIFILIVLIWVFKSPIVPFFSILSVAVAYLISVSLVMNLVAKFNFPLSNFTEVFMVVVLFGIGTDYNILLFDQFKEELSRNSSRLKATKYAIKKAGRTILYSGTAVLIGFATLGLANFSIYKATMAVAVGVFILLAVLLTLNPVFMMLLGKKLFWPSKILMVGLKVVSGIF